MVTPAELRRLEQAATPGPWKAGCAEDGDDPVNDEQYVFRPEYGSQVCSYHDADSADAELIAAARNALPALLNVVELAERHRYHVNEEWERLAAMRPQAPETWLRQEVGDA